MPGMAESIEKLEQRIEQLRAQVREALIGGDRERARDLRRNLRDAERAWDDAVAVLEQEPPGENLRLAGAAERGAPARAVPAAREPAGPPRPAPSQLLLLPLREQVHQALTLLTVPASPRLISRRARGVLRRRHSPPGLPACAGTKNARSAPRRLPGPTMSVRP